MSQHNEGNSKGFVAAAALAEGLIVKLTAANTVNIATAATDKVVGVVQGSASSGNVANVKLRSGAGTYKVKAGGNIAIGDYITTDANGKGIATTTTGNVIIGQALEAGALNDLVEVMPMSDRY